MEDIVEELKVIVNLFIAGDWTNTGLPATIEGAVRSAEKCVELITGSLN